MTIDKFYSAWNDSWVLLNVRRMRMGGNAQLSWTRQRKSWLSEPVSFFKIGVALNRLNRMSDSECITMIRFIVKIYGASLKRSKKCWFSVCWENAIIRQILRNKKASARRMASQSVTLFGLTQVKSALRIEYDVLSLIDIRASTLWISLGGGILSCQKRTVQDNAYTTSNKSFSIQKLIPQAEHDGFLWCHASYDGQFCGISLFCD